MKENTANNRISKKTAVIILIAVVAVALVAVTAGVAGHTVYLNNQKALITNSSDFSVTSPLALTYYYEDGVKSVDLNGIVEVSKGASFSVTKLRDEDGTVVKPDGNSVDVSVKSHRQAQVTVVSKSGKVTSDYRITVAPKAAKNNVINYNVGGGTLNSDVAPVTYSGETEITLPTPTKTFTGASGNTVNFEFQGWYTTANFAEGSEITAISEGTTGEVELYAKFAEHTRKEVDGYTYLYFGSYPQNQVTSYEDLNKIRASTEYINASPDGGRFTYDGQEYCKFSPSNVPNVSDNGYSSNATYIFEVNPVEWRVLKPKNYSLTNGEQVDLLATSVLFCSSYAEDAGAIQNYYKTVASKIGDIDTFIRYYFESDTAYEKSIVKKAVDNMYGEIFKDATEQSKIVTRQFTYYKMATDNSTGTYNCSLWLLNYSEAVNYGVDYGFDPDYTVSDPLRKAMVTDFGAANGVYRATSRSHVGQGSWWLRGAGNFDDQGKNGANGNTSQGYNFRAKRIGYVKYTGYVHTYTSLNMTLRSGVRPAVRINYDSSYFTAS